MIKFRLYFDKDKEVQWLNEMANLGWSIAHFFAGFYLFEPCEKGKYLYQIDFGNNLCSVSDDYRTFMVDAGIEIVQSWGFWAILRQPASKGEFALYSDVDSQIEYYQKILKMFKLVTIIELLCLFMEISSAVRTGDPYVWGCAFLLLSFVIIFMNMTLRTKNTIHELYERKTGIENRRNKTISAFLAVGFLLNSCAFMIQYRIPHYLKMAVQIAAIIFMLIGIYQTAQKRK